MVFPYLEAVLGFMILMYIFETYLDLRQHAAHKLTTLPKPLLGVVSKEKFDKARAYSLDKSYFHFVHEAFTILMDSMILFFGVLPWFWKISGDVVLYMGFNAENEILHTLAFLGGVMIWSQITDLPFSLYSTFVIEARHGFNKQTIWLFFRDMLKGICLSILLGPPIVAAIIVIVQRGGPYLAIYLWSFMFVLSIVLMTLYPILIAPLFNKFTPLPEGGLREKIENLASSLKFPLKKLFVVDGSTRSSHSNVLTFLQFGGYTLVRKSKDLFQSFGFETQPVLIGLVIFQHTVIPLQHLVSFGLNLVSRAFEFQADAFAKNLGYAAPLRAGLVKLQVHWREAAMPMNPNDEHSEIKGKNMAMFLCWILGAGSLFPWNSMVATLDYYITIFPNYHPSRVLTIAVLSFAFGTIIIMTYYEAKMNTRRRNLIGFTLYFIGSVSVLVLNLTTSRSGGIGAYIGLCAICAAFGVAEGHTQGGMIGDLSLMSPELLQSFLAGLAASGTVTSALRLAMKAAFENTKGGLRKGALLFIALSASFELVCVFLYASVFFKLPIVKYYHSKAAAEGSKTVSIDLTDAGIQVQANPSGEEDREQFERLSNKQLLLKNIDYAIDIFLICAQTTSIFPGFLDEDTGSHGLGSWYSLVLTVMFNLWDLISRYLPLIKCLRITSRSGLMIATLARFLFIPAFYFTAKHGDQGWMIMLTSFFGLTNGHLCVCVLMAGPKGYKGPEQNALGNLLQSFVTAGLLAGVAFGWLWLIRKGW